MAAAPFLPLTRQPVFSRIARIWQRCVSSSVNPFEGGKAAAEMAEGEDCAT